MSRVRVRLARALEKTIATGHPWVYRDALEPFDASPGQELALLTRNGRFLASALAEDGPIGARVFSSLDEPYAPVVARRLDAALRLRAELDLGETNALRLVHGEGDRLPGVVVDRYGAFATLKLDGAAASARRDELVAALARPLLELGVESLLVRAGKRDTATVTLAYGPEPERPLTVLERGMKLLVDLYDGQKTGLFLDHRETRARVRRLARGKRVLNLYGYTGGFSVAAGLGGAELVHTVDIAPAAIALAERTWLANGLDANAHRGFAADVPEFLAGSSERYDLVVADPPNFAPNARSLAPALDAYRKLHASCLERTRPGGFYVAASCSSHVDAAAFEESVRSAATEARVPVQLLERSAAPADHPRLLVLPESDYLKVLVLRVLDAEGNTRRGA